MLSELDKSFLTRFVEDEELMAAVQRGVEAYLRNKLPDVTSRDSDQIIGQKTRAIINALALIGESFRDMVKYRSKEGINRKINLER